MEVKAGTEVQGRYRVLADVDVAPWELVVCEDILNPGRAVAFQANFIVNGTHYGVD
jgi:hypothetical protein